MPRPVQHHLALGVDLGLHGFHAVAEPCFGKNQVQRHQIVIALGNGFPMGCRFGRQLRQNSLDFLLFFNQQLPQLIIRLHRLHGLHKKRSAAGRDIVNHARNGVFILAAHRHHIAVPPHGDNGLPQVFGIARRGDDLLQALPNLCPGLAHMPPDVVQGWAGTVGNLLLADNGVGDLVLQKAIGGQRPEITVQRSGFNAVSFAVCLDAPCCPKHPRNPKQLNGIQTSAAIRPLQRRLYILHVPERRIALELHHMAGIGGFLQKPGNLLGIGGRQQFQRPLFSFRSNTALRQHPQNPVQLQSMQ